MDDRPNTTPIGQNLDLTSTFFKDFPFLYESRRFLLEEADFLKSIFFQGKVLMGDILLQTT